MRTEYSAFVRKLFNRHPGEISKDFTHAILGIVTEVNELLTAHDAVNELEELGDLEFFLEALTQVIADHTGKPVDVSERPVYLTKPLGGFIEVECNRLLNDAKRWVGYDKEPANLQGVYWRAANLVAMAAANCQTYSENRIIRANMAKLLKRYPGGEFSHFHAIVRDTGAERDALSVS